MLHVYNVVEHGRRFLRTLQFTSDTGYSYGQPVDGRLSVLLKPVPHWASGDAASLASAGPSLVITRSLDSKEDNLQTFIPRRFVRGLLPEVMECIWRMEPHFSHMSDPALANSQDFIPPKKRKKILHFVSA